MSQQDFSIDGLFAGLQTGSSVSASSTAICNPFKFLDPYGPGDATIFFGRSFEIAEIYHHFFRAQLLVVYGESGVGKTSLIQCGLRSRIPPEDILFVNVRSARNPLENLRSELLKQLGDLDNKPSVAYTEGRSDSKSSLYDLLELLGSTILHKSKTLALVFDQFEELFLFQPPAVREALATEFERWLAANLDVRIVLCIREEYLAHLTEMEKKLPWIYENRLWVRRMSSARAREAIVKACASCHVQIESKLVEEIIAEIGRKESGVDLPLLQVVLDTVFQRATVHQSSANDRSSENEVSDDAGDPKKTASTVPLTLNLYQEIGQAQAILGDFIENRVNRHDDPDIVRGVLKALVTSDGTKRISTSAEIIENASHFGVNLSADQLDALLDSLVNDRILRRDPDNRLVELRHDRLAQTVYAWMTGIERELTEVRAALVNRYKEYEARGHSQDALLDDAFLEFLAPFHSRLRLSESFSQFVSNSIKARNVRSRRIQRALAAFGVIVVAVLAGLSLFSWKSWQRAEQDRVRAERAGKLAARAQQHTQKEAIRATTRALLAEAGRLLAADEVTKTLALLRAAARPQAGKDGVEQVKRAGIYSLAENPVAKVFAGHKKMIRDVAVSLDGRLLATASADHTARIWDLSSGRVLHVLKGHTDSVHSIAFSPDGELVVTASRDKTARIWGVASGKLIHSLQGHRDQVFTAVFSHDGRQIATASRDKTVRLWSVVSGRVLHTLNGHEGAVYSVRYSPHDKIVATASQDRTARLWSAVSGSVLHTLNGHEESVYAVKFSPNGNLAATASKDHTARIWNIVSGRPVYVLRGHKDEVNAVSFSPDGTIIATASSDRTVRIWNVDSGRLMRICDRHKGRVYSVIFSPNGGHIATRSRDGTVGIWEVLSGQLVDMVQAQGIPLSIVFAPNNQLVVGSWNHTAQIWDMGARDRLLRIFTGHKKKLVDIDFAPDGKHLATASQDQTARIWNVATGRVVSVLKGHKGIVTAVAFSANGNHVATASADRTARIWDTATGKPLHFLKGHKHSVTRLAFSPDGRFMATASQDSIRIWNVKTGRLLRVCMVNDAVFSLEFSPRGKWIAVGFKDRNAHILNPQSGETHQVLKHAGWVIAVAFSPDGNLLATATNDSIARIWNVASGQRVQKLEGHQLAVTSLAFSPGGELLATSSGDHTVRVWNVSTGRMIHVLAGHHDVVWTVVFSPQGNLLATGSWDNTARIWDVSTGRCISRLIGHQRSIFGLSFSPNGRRLATASSDGTARLWDATVRPLEDVLRRIGVRTNLRVCHKTFDVVSVLPFPPSETIWAPAYICRKSAAHFVRPVSAIRSLRAERYSNGTSISDKNPLHGIQHGAQEKQRRRIYTPLLDPKKAQFRQK
jgi:WD40 repeat protein